MTTSTIAEVEEKLSDAQREGAGEHDWHERFNLICCRKCGLVRRADGTSNPCRGIVRVALRSGTQPLQGTGE